MKVLNKKLLRQIYRARGQTIAVAMVILCGAANYICVASAHRNLKLTQDTYYQRYRFADFTIMLERAPRTALFKVEAIPGVRQVRGRIIEDVTLDVPGQDEARAGRLISMPDTPQPVLNDVCLLSGRYFEEGVQTEVILSKAFADANGLEPGDSVQASINNKKHTLRVVGIGLSPEYVYTVRNAQELIPSPERFGILWVPRKFAETALDMQEACNDVVGTVDNLEKLEEILDTAEEVLGPYGVFTTIKRQDQISNKLLSDEITGLAVTAKIVPTVFLAIAALIILILLNRMVHNERTQIGLLKAFGYSDWAVALHYVKFALILAVLGCFGAFFVGQWLANGMIKLYGNYYQFPELRSRLYPDVMAESIGISMGFAILGALVAVHRAAQIRPAESMRPLAPRYAYRTVLERATFIWRRFSFTGKMIVRNVSRNKFRAALNVFGITVASGLLLIGFFSVDAMGYLIDFQFREVQREDVKISFVKEHDKSALYEAARLRHVRQAEPLLQYPFTISAGWRSKDMVVIGLQRDAQLMRLLTDKHEPIDVGQNGLVVSDYVADELGLVVGSQVTLKPLMGRVTKEKQVPVSQIIKQYLGMAAYMNIYALSRVLDEPFAMNAALLRTERRRERDLSSHLKDVAAVASVEIKSDSHQTWQDTLAQTMWIMGSFLIFFAGVIAFAVIYNVTLISLAERQRELASLRVLGFTTAEVGRIVYNENLLVSAIGLVLGIPFGMSVCRLMVYAYTNDLYRFPYHIEPRSFAIMVVLTILFVAIANLAVRRNIRRLDMVEVLKARE